MNLKNVLPVGVAAAVVASAGIALLTASPAAVAATCNAPQGSVCLAIEYRTSRVKSIRVNGRCFIGPSGTHSNGWIGKRDNMNIQSYGGTRCEGGTQVPSQTDVLVNDAAGWRTIRVY